jgi:N-acetylglucosaminyl-diphospho-decaprenol L-rhamnosyltransferase
VSPASSSPGLDIVIVNYNTRDDLVACLRSLVTAPPQRSHTITVVDNGSTDGSVEAVRGDFAIVQLIELGRNAGFAAANNAGIRAVSSPLVLLLNSDTLVPPQALDVLCDRLEASGATAAGPRLIDGNGRPEISWGPMLSPWSEWIQARRIAAARSTLPQARRRVDALTSIERRVDWVSGACLLVRRDAALEAGLLDERYFMYEEDVDFCAALRKQGGSILFTPASTVIHLRGRSLKAGPAQRPSYYDRSHLAFYAKHSPGWLPLLRLWKKLRGRLS